MVCSFWPCKLPHKVSFDEDDLNLDTTRLRRFSLVELQIATNKFSKENRIGRGGYGEVYRGKLDDGSVVAVKRFQRKLKSFPEVQFQTSIEISNMAAHRSVLQLRGFCLTRNERLLVYPHMANGSLSYQLREKHESQPALNWDTRKRIAFEVAEGICYLHKECNPKIIHRDIKAANILLDEEFEAVVGDFGLAKLMDSSDPYVTDKVCGTLGHICPEYLSTGSFSSKTDVYGFGALLLELVTGQRICDLSRLANECDVHLIDWVCTSILAMVLLGSNTLKRFSLPTCKRKCIGSP